LKKLNNNENSALILVPISPMAIDQPLLA